jgi:hypothetical protein
MALLLQAERRAKLPAAPPAHVEDTPLTSVGS